MERELLIINERVDYIKDKDLYRNEYGFPLDLNVNFKRR